MPAAGMSIVKTFLSNTSLAVFVFLIAKITMRKQQLQVCQQQLYQPGCKYLFSLSNRKNRNAEATDVLARLQVPTFAFPLVKIRTQSSSRCASSRYVWLVANTCFCFFTGVPAADIQATNVLNWLQIPIFAFLIVKIIMWGQ